MIVAYRTYGLALEQDEVFQEFIRPGTDQVRFRILRLQPLNFDQAQTYFDRLVSGDASRLRLRQIYDQMDERHRRMIENPLLLHFMSLLPSERMEHIYTVASLYKAVVDLWLEREHGRNESKQYRTRGQRDVDVPDVTNTKRKLLQLLAHDMIKHGVMQLTDDDALKILADHLREHLDDQEDWWPEIRYEGEWRRVGVIKRKGQPAVDKKEVRELVEWLCKTSLLRMRMWQMMESTMEFIHDSLRDYLWADRVWDEHQTFPEEPIFPVDGLVPIVEYARGVKLAMQLACEQGGTRHAIEVFAKGLSDACVYPKRHLMFYFCDFTEYTLIEELYKRGLLEPEEAHNTILALLDSKVVSQTAKERLVIMLAEMVGATSEEFNSLAASWMRFSNEPWVIHAIGSILAEGCMKLTSAEEYTQAQDSFRLMLDIGMKFAEHLALRREGAAERREMEWALFFYIIGPFVDIDQQTWEIVVDEESLTDVPRKPLFPLRHPGQTPERHGTVMGLARQELVRMVYSGGLFLPLSEEVATAGLGFCRQLLDYCHYPILLLLLSKFLNKLSEWCSHSAVACEDASSTTALWESYKRGQSQYKVGLDWFERGGVSEAIEAFLDAVENLRKVVDRLPALVEAQITLGNAFHMLAVTLRTVIENDYQTAATLGKRMFGKEPGRWQDRNPIMDAMYVGMLLDTAGSSLRNAHEYLSAVPESGDVWEQHRAHLDLAGVWLQSYLSNEGDNRCLEKMEDSLENSVSCGAELTNGGMKDLIALRYCQLAEVYLRLGRLDEAHNGYRRALEFDPSCTEAREALA